VPAVLARGVGFGISTEPSQLQSHETQFAPQSSHLRAQVKTKLLQRVPIQRVSQQEIDHARGRRESDWVSKQACAQPLRQARHQVCVGWYLYHCGPRDTLDLLLYRLAQLRPKFQQGLEKRDAVFCVAQQSGLDVPAWNSARMNETMGEIDGHGLCSLVEICGAQG
jgi:hypothetical protein